MAKKSGFFTCTGCRGKFASGTGFMAPKNKLNLKNVCKPCFKKHFSKPPMPAVSSNVLKNMFGSFMSFGGGLISNTASGVISNGGSGLISNKANPMVAAGGMNLVGHDGSSLIGQDGASVVSNGGSGFRR